MLRAEAVHRQHQHLDAAPLPLHEAELAHAAHLPHFARDDAVAAARAAFPAWSRTSNDERKAKMHELAGALEANMPELMQLVTQESGKPMAGLNMVGSGMEVGGSAAWAHYNAELELPVDVIQDNDEARIEVHRKPLGVVASIGVMLLITSGFVGLGVAIGSKLDDFHAFQLISTFVLWPLFMLSGVFFPIDVVPPPLQVAMLLDPMFYGVELLRWCLQGSGTPFLGPYGWLISLIVLLTFNSLIIGLGTFLFSKAQV